MTSIGKVMPVATRDRTPFGQRLLEARRGAGLTQVQVCERLHISQGTLSELERDAHSSGLVPQLASLYGADPHYLATGQIGVRENGPSYSGGSVAQSLSHPAGTVPHLEWGALMPRTNLPPRFTVAMPDASMLPRIKPGDVVAFAAGERPRPGDGVLVRDGDGVMYVRVYRERRADAWEAHAANDAYQPLDSQRDQLQVLAVLVGLQQRWG